MDNEKESKQSLGQQNVAIENTRVLKCQKQACKQSHPLIKKDFPDFIQEIIDAGGLVPMLKRKL